MRLDALYVDDERVFAKRYAENIGISLKDICDAEVEFSIVERPEDAKVVLPSGQTRFKIVFVDMMYPTDNGDLVNRGEEVILQALKTPGVLIVVVTQGDRERPNLREECFELGAHLFVYKQDLPRINPRTSLSGWDQLSAAICEQLSKNPKNESSAESQGVTATLDAAQSAVFVVYGRNRVLRKGLFEFLRSIGLRPFEWAQLAAATVKAQGGGNPSVLATIQHGFRIAGGCVVLFSGDDEAQLCDALRRPTDEGYEHEVRKQPRQNVLFEAGYALGVAPSRTLILRAGDSLRPMSDLAELNPVRLSDSLASRQDVANRLAELGLAVDLRGTDWHTAGKLE